MYHLTVPPARFHLFTLAIQVAVYWYATMVLIFTCPIAKNVELLFMCRLPICVSFVKCLLKCFVHLKNRVLYYLSGITVHIIPLSGICVANTFSFSVASLFIFLTFFFDEHSSKFLLSSMYQVFF